MVTVTCCRPLCACPEISLEPADSVSAADSRKCPSDETINRGPPCVYIRMQKDYIRAVKLVSCLPCQNSVRIYVGNTEITGCALMDHMNVVWFRITLQTGAWLYASAATERASKWQQFHAAPAMSQFIRAVLSTPLRRIFKTCCVKQLQSLIQSRTDATRTDAMSPLSQEKRIAAQY